MRRNLQIPADLVTFTEEMFNGKLHFFSTLYEANPVAKLAQDNASLFSLIGQSRIEALNPVKDKNQVKR